MRAYIHHLGDWATHTRHLPWLEQAAYHLLIQAYYVGEKALPLDVSQVNRAVGAITRNERDAVRNVLAAFFERREDGFHQKRCDAEIARNRQKSKEATELANRRWSNVTTMARVSNVMSDTLLLQDHLANSHFTNSGIEEKTEQDNARQISHANGNAGGITGGNALRNANQLPIPKNYSEHTPIDATNAAVIAAVVSCRGFEIDAGDPRFRACLEAGASPAEFASAADFARERGKPWAYALGVLSNRLEDARQGLKTGPGSSEDPRMAYFHTRPEKNGS